jgi:glycosyltransferase involved in cell wall biosynthesis
MKVVHIACVAPPEVGGIGEVAAREVSGLRARGMDAHLIAPEPRETYPGMSAERSFIHPIRPLLRIGNGAFLSGWREFTKGADIIHLHFPFYGFEEMMFLPSVALPPVVMTFHMDAKPLGWKGWMVSLHRLCIQPLLARKMERVFVSSLDYIRQSSLRHWSAHHPEQVVELPFGVDTDFFSPGPKTRARFSLPESCPVITFVGGMDTAHAFKGVEELLQAFALLHSDAHLLLVGDGDRRPAYEERARALGIASRVHFLGRVDRETLRDAYRTADLFAFPSTSGAEAFGLVALEAQACGVPVVASSLPGLRTIVQSEETGLLVPPKQSELLASALGRLLGDEALRAKMGERARARAVEHFSWDRHLEELERVYREVLGISRELRQEGE